jgi:AAT family amino acid transporter/GABA permease
MWLYPYLTWATIALITFVLGYMLTDTADGGGRDQVVLSTVAAAGVVAFALVRERLTGRTKTTQDSTPTS